MKCTGLHCPMQHGYDVENCKLTDCKYRTKPKTNFERIKAMSVEEMATFLQEVEYRRAIDGGGAKWKTKNAVAKWLESEVEKG